LGTRRESTLLLLWIPAFIAKAGEATNGISIAPRYSDERQECDRKIKLIERGNGMIGEKNKVKVALLVRLEAKAGKEADVETFLLNGLSIVQDEPSTTTWYAIKLGPSTFGIFDTFADESGRDAHLSGRVAAALKAQAADLLSQPPSIEKVKVLAAKLPH
jgi:quinol monooxygenase YgiN